MDNSFEKPSIEEPGKLSEEEKKEELTSVEKPAIEEGTEKKTPKPEEVADIEKRRQEELNKIDKQTGEKISDAPANTFHREKQQIVKTWIKLREENAKLTNDDFLDKLVDSGLVYDFNSLPSDVKEMLWDGKYKDALSDFAIETYEDRINSKYDAEIKALK